jgi:hypothetical protein
LLYADNRAIIELKLWKYEPFKNILLGDIEDSSNCFNISVVIILVVTLSNLIRKAIHYG